MKMRKISHLVFGLLLFCSCSKDLETAPVFNPLQEDGYVIPIEKALASLEDFLIDQGMALTKGGVNDYVDNYFAVSMPTTKTSGIVGDILYAVNFADDSGYALLAADSRIQEDILAVIDQGSVSPSDFEDTPLLKKPTENDDLSLSEYDEMVASGVLAAEANVVNNEVKSYAANQISKFHKDDGAPGNSDPIGGGGGAGGGGESGGSDSTPETYSWRTVSEKPRLLRTAWTQSTYDDDIFNKYCPMVGLVWKVKAPAGCVCIAISQIMAYHEYPTNLVCNDMPISYPEIKNIYYYDGNRLRTDETEESKEMLARYCINVGRLCNTKYHSIFGSAFGFAWPWNAKACLETMGYQNVSLSWGREEDKVLSSLDDDCPVFMSAIAKAFAGHAWVIDGYIKREYVSSKGRVLNSQTLVHCNWGWAGDCNGYFTSGIFHTQEAHAYDTGLTHDQNYKYWSSFNIITYDKPQK